MPSVDYRARVLCGLISAERLNTPGIASIKVDRRICLSVYLLPSATIPAFSTAACTRRAFMCIFSTSYPFTCRNRWPGLSNGYRHAVAVSSAYTMPPPPPTCNTIFEECSKFLPNLSRRRRDALYTTFVANPNAKSIRSSCDKNIHPWRSPIIARLANYTDHRPHLRVSAWQQVIDGCPGHLGGTGGRSPAWPKKKARPTQSYSSCIADFALRSSLALPGPCSLRTNTIFSEVAYPGRTPNYSFVEHAAVPSQRSRAHAARDGTEAHFVRRFQSLLGLVIGARGSWQQLLLYSVRQSSCASIFNIPPLPLLPPTLPPLRILFRLRRQCGCGGSLDRS